MSKSIRVKLLSRVRFDVGKLPNSYPELEFCFGADDRDYDWLVIYDDLPKQGDERFSVAQEELACSADKTILITFEPSSIRYYGDQYLDQFRYVLTSHEPEYLKHRGRIDCPPIGVWFYGTQSNLFKEDQLPEKTENLSIFLSNKAQRHTTHRLRHDFSHAIAHHFGNRIARFGWDYHPVDIKAEGLDHFRYTVALENHIGDHHWTEKLSDAFLGCCLPFYAGCPNAADYFPEDSFVAVDMRDVSGSIEIIERAIHDKLFEQRLPAILEARRRVIEDYTLANFIGRTIKQATADSAFAENHPGRIISRRRMAKSSPLKTAVYLTKKMKNRLHFLRQNAAYLKQAKH
jgi:hypothetical protein